MIDYIAGYNNHKSIIKKRRNLKKDLISTRKVYKKYVIFSTDSIYLRRT